MKINLSFLRRWWSALTALAAQAQLALDRFMLPEGAGRRLVSYAPDVGHAIYEDVADGSMVVRDWTGLWLAEQDTPVAERRVPTLLTAENVESILTYCLFRPGEAVQPCTIGEGVSMRIRFHPGRLAERRRDILGMVQQLPDDFMEDKGGGMSFINADTRADGFVWGEREHVDQLLMLGCAAGYVKISLPRSMWYCLPSGLPYFFVTRDERREGGD